MLPQGRSLQANLTFFFWSNTSSNRERTLEIRYLQNSHLFISFPFLLFFFFFFYFPWEKGGEGELAFWGSYCLCARAEGIWLFSPYSNVLIYLALEELWVNWAEVSGIKKCLPEGDVLAG